MRLDLKKYKYGDDLPAIDADRATGFKRKGDVFVCDLSLAVHRDSTDAITAIYMNTAIFHTENFWNAPPEDFTVRAKDSSHAISTENLVDGTISERQLGGFRFMLYNFLEPLCTDRDKSVVWLYDEHNTHMVCPGRVGVIFILPNKHAVLRDLRLLGCDLEE